MRVAVLGSTGSIGVSTLDVLARHPDRFSIAVLAARSNDTGLIEQCLRHQPQKNFSQVVQLFFSLFLLLNLSLVSFLANLPD